MGRGARSSGDFVTRDHEPHSLMSVTFLAEASPLVVVRCFCSWRSKARLPMDAYLEYEAHVMDMGAHLGPVPWREPAE